MTATVTPYGDTAVLVEVGTVHQAHRMVAALESALADAPATDPAANRVAAGDVVDVVVGYRSVVVHTGRDPDRFGAVLSWVTDLAADVPLGDPGPGHLDPLASPVPAPVELPVEFDGPDLAAVASRLDMTTEDVVALVTGAELEVAFLGFSPGFPYLIGLPAPLSGLGRRPTPRPSVPAGSVAVAGGFASVYPQSTPGGWHLLGRTPVSLFDPDRPPFALLRPGDRVRFTVQEPSPGPSPPSGGDGPRPRLQATGPRRAEVLRPGLLTLVEDAGRSGMAGMGVPGAGAADTDSMVLANRLVGNADGAPVLEVTGSGPAVRFAAPAHCAVVGTASGTVEVSVDGLACPDGTVIPVEPGQVLDVGRVTAGLRAYLAVAGGFDTPQAVGSHSSDLLSGIGPPALEAGDHLGLGPPGRPHGLLAPAAAVASPGPVVVRVIAGPHALGPTAWEHLLAEPWTVDGRSDRIGLRLTGRDPVPSAADGAIPSTGMVTGSIQVPPDGAPIVLMPDHATVGGYPVVGCVIAADLPALGQLRPGDPVRFTGVELDEALRIAVRHRETLAARVSGWFPTRAGT